MKGALDLLDERSTRLARWKERSTCLMKGALGLFDDGVLDLFDKGCDDARNLTTTNHRDYKEHSFNWCCDTKRQHFGKFMHANPKRIAKTPLNTQSNNIHLHLMNHDSLANLPSAKCASPPRQPRPVGELGSQNG